MSSSKHFFCRLGGTALYLNSHSLWRMRQRRVLPLEVLLTLTEPDITYWLSKPNAIGLEISRVSKKIGCHVYQVFIKYHSLGLPEPYIEVKTITRRGNWSKYKRSQYLWIRAWEDWKTEHQHELAG